MKRPYKPGYLNATSAPKAKKSKQTILRDWIISAIILICAILFFAAIYYIEALYDQGPIPTFTPSNEANESQLYHYTSKLNFDDCVYFSAVTISTLGYGDYRPVSFSRTTAGFESIIGIVLMGIFVSRLVSRQQDRLTKRLLTGQLNLEIQNFRDMLLPLLESFLQLRALSSNDINSEKYRIELSTLLDKTAGLMQSMARYWRHEAQLPDLTLIIPISASGRMLGEVISIIECLSIIVDSETVTTIREEDRKSIRNITESALLMADVLNSHIGSKGIRHSIETLYPLIVKLRKQFKLKKPYVKRKKENFLVSSARISSAAPSALPVRRFCLKNSGWNWIACIVVFLSAAILIRGSKRED